MRAKNKNKISENFSIFVKNENTEEVNLVIEDKEEVKKYSIQEIKNKVIHGDAFNVLPKIEGEVFDMIFIDPPYFLQLPNKEFTNRSKKWLK
mgnify:CR=1 FL=1